MLRHCSVAFVLVLCVITLANGQSSQRNKSGSYVVIPREHILLVIASQPSAPIRFEEARLLMSVDGHDLDITYSVHNVGTKPIRYFTPVMWTSLGTGGTLLYSGPSHGLLQPGEILKDESMKDIVPLNGDLRDRLKLKGPMRALIVLMVEEVRFADDTTYADHNASKALLSYFEDLSARMERIQNPDRAAAKGKPK